MPTCKATRPFAFWIDRAWMVGSLADWKDGWIRLVVIHFDDRKDPRKKVMFDVSWNGERFVRGKTVERMAREFEDEHDALVHSLRQKLPGPGVTPE